MFFYETIESLNCQGCRILQPIDKKHWQTEVLYYVFWSILSQMRHVCCEIFPKKKKKKIVPKFVCSMVQFSMPAILDRTLHLASQTMYFVKILWQDTQNIKGLVPEGAICILTILRKSPLKILAMFQTHCRTGLLYFPGNMFISRTAVNTGKYREIWEIPGNTKFQIMDF